MTPERQKKGQKIFLQAIEKKKQQRPDYIQKTCLDDPQLLAYVQDLLAAKKKSGVYFSNLKDSVFPLNEIEEHCFRDFQVGQYQISNLLKQGGMGSIFLAHRADGEFEREVIIKMIPIDLDFDQNQVRFAHEKEILAGLIHPNIVQLYDSGVTAEGQSYFVMELIKGNNIIQYCNQQKLTIKQRLKLFVVILGAVQYAHQHLVIHGDIKPSNIMVTVDGQVKLLDFGIATLVHQEGQKPEAYSIEYQTPEHANKRRIITTTDIHQLGQLLFEMISGTEPRLARQKDFSFPLLPGQLASIQQNSPESFNALLKNTSSNKTQLKWCFNSALYHIIHKALSPEPGDRYDTAQAFADDLIKFENGYCVEAHPGSRAYRFQRYLYRHRLMVFLVSTLTAVLAGFTLMTALHNTELSIERDKAVTIKNLLVDVFSVADPNKTPGQELTATEVLDTGLQRIRERFNEPTEIEADLLEEIAHTYQNLGNYTQAATILEDAYQIRQSIQSDEQFVLAGSMMLLGENERLLAHFDDAESWLDQSLDIFEQESATYLAEIATVKGKLSRVKVSKGELADAEKMALDATETQKVLYGEDHIKYAQSLNDLSAVYFRQGKYKQVADILLITKNVREKLWQEKPLPILDKDYATNINNIGLAYYLQGNLTDGERYFRQAIDLREQIFAKPHPEQAQSLTNLGLLLNDAGSPDHALPYLEQALTVRQLTLETGHPRINDAWNNLAMIYHENSEFSKAAEIYQSILGSVIQTRGEAHPQTASLYTNMANTLLELNEFQKAYDYLKKSLDSRLKTLPEDHLYLSYSYIGLGRAQVALGDIPHGKDLILKGLSIREQKLPADHWLIGEAYYAHAMVAFIQGQADLEMTQNACAILKEKKGESNYLTQKCLALLDQITDKPL